MQRFRAAVIERMKAAPGGIRFRRPKIFIHGHQHIRKQTKVEETVVIGA
jgi:hypothetical protein